jgi:lipopolysaccharide transport system permease protein
VATAPLPSTPSDNLRPHLWHFLADFTSITLLLVGAMLSAVQFRLRVPLGLPLGPDYVAQPLMLYVFLLVGSLVSAVAGASLRRILKLQRGRRPHFINHIVGTGVSFMLVVVLLPDVSLLQMAYYSGFSIVFGLFTILWTPTLPDAKEETTLFRHLGALWQARGLLWLWTTTNIRVRYSETALGMLWIVLLPLAQSAIMAMVFSLIIRGFDTGDVPFVAFFLIGITFYTFFQQGTLNSTKAIVNQLGLIAQVYFPREILVIVRFAESLIDLLLTFGAVLFINAVIGVVPRVYILYFPLILLVQSVFMLGLMLYLSYGSVTIRDIPQLVAVVIQLLFFLSPILYPASFVPDDLRFILFVNPLSGIIEAYRSVLLYHETPDFISLYYPLVVGGILLYTGYLFFKANEGNMADYT